MNWYRNGKTVWEAEVQNFAPDEVSTRILNFMTLGIHWYTASVHNDRELNYPVKVGNSDGITVASRAAATWIYQRPALFS